MYDLLKLILEAKLSSAASKYRKGLRAFHQARIKGDTQVKEPSSDDIVQNAGRARMRSNPGRRMQKALRKRLTARKNIGEALSKEEELKGKKYRVLLRNSKKSNTSRDDQAFRKDLKNKLKDLQRKQQSNG